VRSSRIKCEDVTAMSCYDICKISPGLPLPTFWVDVYVVVYGTAAAADANDTEVSTTMARHRPTPRYVLGEFYLLFSIGNRCTFSVRAAAEAALLMEIWREKDKRSW
jgi:hypothetical protein